MFNSYKAVFFRHFKRFDFLISGSTASNAILISDEDDSSEREEKRKETSSSGLSPVVSPSDEELNSNSAKKRLSLFLKKRKAAMRTTATNKEQLFQKGERVEQSTHHKDSTIPQECLDASKKVENKKESWTPTDNAVSPYVDVLLGDSANDLPQIGQSYSISDETFADYVSSAEKISKGVSFEAEQSGRRRQEVDTANQSRNLIESLDSSDSSCDLFESSGVSSCKQRTTEPSDSRASDHRITHRTAFPHSENEIISSENLKSGQHKSKTKTHFGDRMRPETPNEQLFLTKNSKKRSRKDVIINDDTDFSDFVPSPIMPRRSAKKKKRTKELEEDDDSQVSSMLTSSKKKRIKHVFESDDSEASECYVSQSQTKKRRNKEQIEVLDSSETEAMFKESDGSVEANHSVLNHTEAVLLSSDNLDSTEEESPVTVKCTNSQPVTTPTLSSPLVEESFPFQTLTRKTASSNLLVFKSSIGKNAQRPLEQAVGASKFFDDTSWRTSRQGKTAIPEKQLRKKLFRDAVLHVDEVSVENDESEEGNDVPNDDWLNNTEEDIYWSQDYNNMPPSSVWQSIEDDLRANQSGDSSTTLTKQEQPGKEKEDLQGKRKEAAGDVVDTDAISPSEVTKESPLYDDVITECDMEGISGSDEGLVLRRSTRSVSVYEIGCLKFECSYVFSASTFVSVSLCGSTKCPVLYLCISNIFLLL